MDVITRIKQQIESNPVVLYMKGTPDFPMCGFSSRVTQILKSCGADFAYVNVLEDAELREQMKVFSNWPTFPQLYINGELVGGCDIAVSLYQTGELQKLLDEVKNTVQQ